MKKLLYISLLLVLFCSCSKWIDIKPENAVSYTNGMQTPNDMESILTGAQASMQDVLFGLRAQEYAGVYHNGCNDGGGTMPGGIEFRSHNWYNSMVDLGYWSGYYHVMGLANIILSNIKKDWPKERQEYFMGQAYFLKGMCYFDLARRWGNVPIVPENDYEAPCLPVSSNHDVLEEATRCALEAFKYLPRFAKLKFSDGVFVDNKQYGSKEITAALLAHLYAWRASVEEDILPDKKNLYWKESEKYASMLIEKNGELSGYATLENSITALKENTLNNRHGKESIFELEFNTKYTKKMPQGDFYIASKFFGYPYRHGSTMEDQPGYSLSCERVYALYGNKDVPDDRRNAWFDVDELYDPSVKIEWPDTPARIEKRELWPGSGWWIDVVVGGVPRVAPNNAYVKKFYKQFLYSESPLDPVSFQNFDVNKIIWRLADIVLLRAEVRNFMGNTNGAVADLNTIRQRANASLYPAPQDKEGLQKAIFREREKELIFENHRFFDIMRNPGYYKTELPANFRSLTENDIRDGALYLPEPREAGEYNTLMTPNKYWYNKRN